MDKKINRAWFREQMERIGYSQNEFARALGLDRGAWSKTLSGQRKMSDAERVKAAKAFSLPLHELLPHVGVPVELPITNAGAPIREVPERHAAATVVGSMDALDGSVTFDVDMAKQDEAQLAVLGDPYLSGWVVRCRPSERAAALARECEAGIVELADGRYLLRKVRAGFAHGRFDLGPFLGFGSQENDVDVIAVIPVVGLGPV